MFDVMGYGRAPDSDDAMLSDAIRCGLRVLGTAVIVAKALGLDVESVEPFREVAVTDARAARGRGVIPAGTVGAIKLGIRRRLWPGRDDRRARHLDGS